MPDVQSRRLPSSSNRLLRAMSAKSFARFSPHLDATVLTLGEILSNEGSEQDFIYFPTRGTISLLACTLDGSSAELALIGRDGMVGFPVVLGTQTTTSRATVQVAGDAFRIPSGLAVRLIAADAAVKDLLLRYFQVLWTQASQTALCNRHHTLAQQFCRWILHSHDLIDSDDIRMTQQLVADMLGSRREGVSLIARELKSAGTILYSRGLIRVLDRAALEDRVCECYRIVVDESNRLLPSVRH